MVWAMGLMPWLLLHGQTQSPASESTPSATEAEAKAGVETSPAPASAGADPRRMDGNANSAVDPEQGGSVMEIPKAEPVEIVVGPSTLPSEFLDKLSLEAKVRWRSLYRAPAPAAPPMERLKVAFTLGGLLADSHLAFRAGDAQQFKNINQDILKYCSSLALTDKLTPLVMNESKMAENQDWAAVRPMLHEKQMMIERLLGGQRDEDQATLVNLGLWFRLFEVTAEVVLMDTEAKDRRICVGSVALLESLAIRYETLSERARADDSVAVIGKCFGHLLRRWPNLEGQPTDELVGFTAEKVKAVNEKLTLK